MKTGSSAISAPQSGMTNCAVRSRMPFQIVLEHRRGRGQSFGEPAIST